MRAVKVPILISDLPISVNMALDQKRSKRVQRSAREGESKTGTSSCQVFHQWERVWGSGVFQSRDLDKGLRYAEI